MQSPGSFVAKELVLVGGGHAHAIVLRRFGMQPLPGLRLTLVASDVHTPYSGMLPGLVAGHYGFDEAHIDLEPLARFAGARLLRATATGLDPDARLLHLDGRPPLAYDLLSLDIGSTPTVDDVPGAVGRVLPAKPIAGFLERWERLLERARAGHGPLRLATVGGGAGGVELTLSACATLRRELHACGRGADALQASIHCSGPTVLTTHGASARRRIEALLAARGIKVRPGRRIAEVVDGGLIDDAGQQHPADEILWVTQASAAPWIAASGLATDERGFVAVDATLASTSHRQVFAAGDIAAVLPHPREKAGVFAVRQGKPLADNLRRAARGQAPRPFRPQQRFLTILGSGDGDAVASRGRWSLQGAWVWRWKDRIDRRFMQRFEQLPEMESPPGPELADGVASAELQRSLREAPMRCGGCGAKVGASVLERALARLPRPDAPVAGVLAGRDAPDDAALLEVPVGQQLVQTVDHLRPLVDDPYVFGRLVACHCLGDVFAMGAVPWTALATVVLPHGTEAVVEEQLVQLLSGALSVLHAEGAALVGGHTAEGPELSLGLTVNGLVAPGAALHKGGLRVGDALVLTKPLGTGALFAAAMHGAAKGRWIAAALEGMQRSNGPAARALLAHGATAATDVTGFGLIGHLAEMVKASQVGVLLDVDAVQLLDGAAACVAAGHLSTLQPANLRLRRVVADVEAAARHPAWPLLFDPQTSGGLMAGVPAERVESLLATLREAGDVEAAVIGRVVATPAGEPPVRLVRNSG